MRETDVASVDIELNTLAADDVVVDDEASIEVTLCFDVVRRSMLSGRDVAPSPGLRVVLLEDAEPEADAEGVVAEEMSLGVEEEAQMRPRKRAAAVVTSADACAALVPR